MKIAAENGGEYVPGTAASVASAKGVTLDGIKWRASFDTSRASNGEVFGIASYVVTNGDLRRTFSGMSADLPSALDTFRAERDGALVYVVAHGISRGAELGVTEDSFTRDLGQARWAQQQTGNLADVWVARLGDDGTATVLREFLYTSKVGLEAMHAYMSANDLNIYDAQKSLATSPAMTVIDARNPIPASGPRM